ERFDNFELHQAAYRFRRLRTQSRPELRDRRLLLQGVPYGHFRGTQSRKRALRDEEEQRIFLQPEVRPADEDGVACKHRYCICSRLEKNALLTHPFVCHTAVLLLVDFLQVKDPPE